LFTSPAQPASNQFVPAQIQAATVNAAGVLTYGNKVTLPVGSGIRNFGGSEIVRLLYACFRSDGSAYLTGIAPAFTNKPSMLIEIEADGANITAKTNFPFAYPSTLDHSPPLPAALENPNRKREFMFIETPHMYGFNPNFYFGFGSDVPIPSNIAGIALDPPLNGFVKVQVSGKYLPKVIEKSPISQGLMSGFWYMAGNDGTLVRHGGTNPPLAFAATPESLLFLGALPILA
jgi:hypothetical protein